MDFAAPITVWSISNRTYSAYSAADDEFVLMPSQAFFVQKPELVDAITFQPAGGLNDQASTVKVDVARRIRDPKATQTDSIIAHTRFCRCAAS